MPGKSSGKPAGAKRVSELEWQQWLDAFRLHPNQPTAVAKIMGCPVARAMRAWNRGWPSAGKPPIRDVLDDEARQARVLAAGGTPNPADLVAGAQPDKRAVDILVQRERERIALRMRDLQTKKEEAELVQITRHNSVALAGMSAQLLQRALALGDKLEEQLRTEKLDVHDTLRLMRSTAAIVRLNNEASKMAMQMERLLVGAPDSEDGDDVRGERLSPAAAAKWIEAGARAIRRAMDRGYIPGKVIDAHATPAADAASDRS